MHCIHAHHSILILQIGTWSWLASNQSFTRLNKKVPLRCNKIDSFSQAFFHDLHQKMDLIMLKSQVFVLHLEIFLGASAMIKWAKVASCYRTSAQQTILIPAGHIKAVKPWNLQRRGAFSNVVLGFSKDFLQYAQKMVSPWGDTNFSWARSVLEQTATHHDATHFWTRPTQRILVTFKTIFLLLRHFWR